MNEFLKIQNELRRHITLTIEKASYFYKTEKGGYAEHDKFLGITIPNLRKLAKIYENIDVPILEQFLASPYNEERAFALIILVNNYQNHKENRANIYDFYIKNLLHVNNWNLVDISAHHIVGFHLYDKNRDFLFKIAASNNLWERRISIVSSWYFILHNDLEYTFRLAEFHMNDPHDLMHKACGWMLREAGKKDINELIKFLSKHAFNMPRTMLRYAIEKFEKEKRDYFLGLK